MLPAGAGMLVSGVLYVDDLASARSTEELRRNDGVDEVDVSRLTGCHWLLLRLAGSVPDDLLSQCRRWLGEGRALDVGRAVTYAVLSHHLAVGDPDVDLLAELLAAGGADNSVLSIVDTGNIDPMPRYGFAPTRARADADVCMAADSIPGQLLPQAYPEDDVDRAALTSVDRHPELRAVWRAWRYPGDGSPWPLPRRVYVVETDIGADLVAVTAAVQTYIATAGDPFPQVEVYPMAADLPSYQRLARLYGALLWAREPDPGIRVAVVFDTVDEDGPGFVPDHPLVTAGEMGRLLAFLRDGEPLPVTAAHTNDVVDPRRRSEVPMNLRTDGHWIWSDAAAYYLERYRLAPDAQFLAHGRARAYRRRAVDGAAMYRAMAALQQPSGQRQTWLYGR
jgi:hypothetical protein